MTSRFSTPLLIATGLLLGACAQSATHTDAPHWSYAGATGPAHWGELSEAYAAASEGERQSPIDLAATAIGDAPTMTHDYRPVPLRISNTGHSVQVDGAGGGSMRVGDESYELLQFHFHAPSEHTIEGISYPLECHLVHRNTEGRLAVLGVLFEEGAESDWLAPIVGHLPAEAGAANSVDGVNVDLEALLSPTTGTWRYSGSLTTPPCTEDVSWIVCTERASLSASQIEALRMVYHGNNRPTQPLNGRSVVRTSPSSN